MLSYVNIAPSNRLSHIVVRYVIFEGKLGKTTFVQDVIPALTEFFTFNLGEQLQTFLVGQKPMLLKDCFVSGLHSKPYTAFLEGDVKIIGAHIRTPFMSQLFGIPSHYLSDTALTLEDLQNVRLQEAFERAKLSKCISEAIKYIEQFIAERIYANKPLDSKWCFWDGLSAIRSSCGAISIKELCDRCSVTERTLQRHFLLGVGLSPKTYASLVRFNHVISVFNRTSYISPDILIKLGYYDEAHFIHEFKRFTSMSPTRYFRTHAGVNQFFSDYDLK